MEQEREKIPLPDIREYEDSDSAAGNGSAAFKTSFLGFDKEDVMGYIDRLVKDISVQKESIEQSLGRLTEQNRELIERINRYEQQSHSFRKILSDEKQYNKNAREREELYKRAVAVLQEKVVFLQHGAPAPPSGEYDSAEERAKRAGAIVLRLREELLRKDESIGKMSAELSRRNDIIINQDRILTAKDTQIGDYIKSLEEAGRQNEAHAEEAARMSENLSELRARAAELEEEHKRLAAELDDAKARLSAALVQQQGELKEIEAARMRVREESETFEEFKKGLREERRELDGYREQLRIWSERISQEREQNAAERESLEIYTEEVRKRAERLAYEQSRRDAERIAEPKERYAYDRFVPAYDGYGERSRGLGEEERGNPDRLDFDRILRKSRDRRTPQDTAERRRYYDGPDDEYVRPYGEYRRPEMMREYYPERGGDAYLDRRRPRRPFDARKTEEPFSYYRSSDYGFSGEGRSPR